MTDALRELAALALQGGEGAVPTLRGVIDQIPESVRSTGEGEVIVRFIRFLIDLARADNKEAFLTKADGEMVGILRRFME